MFGSPDRHGGGRHPPGIRQHNGPLHAAVQQAAVRGRKSGHRHASGVQGQEELQGMHEEGAYGPTARSGVFFCLPLSRVVINAAVLAFCFGWFLLFFGLVLLLFYFSLGGGGGYSFFVVFVC